MATRKLYRSRTDRVLFGVCGGMGEYFDIDPVIIRLIFVILTIAGGAGILFYLVCGLVIPEEPSTKTEEKTEVHHDAPKEPKQDKPASKMMKYHREQIFGLILVFIGIILLFGNIISWVFKLWPVILVVLGLILVVGRLEREF